MRRLATLILAALLLVMSIAAPTPGQATGRDITVFAAASLKTALDELAERYRAETGTRIIVSTAGSPALARQIEAGAPADIFISADPDWMDHLQARDLIRADSRRDLLGNSLVLIAAPGRPAAPLDALARELGSTGRLAVANMDAVPAGRYARAALIHLGLWDGLKDRLAQTENVRAALALVARGEAPFGIVYATDAAAEPRVTVSAAIPADSHPPVLYPAALTRHARKAPAAAFLDWLSGPAAAALFQAHGFTLPAGPR